MNPRPPRCERGALPTELLPHLRAGKHSRRFPPALSIRAPEKLPTLMVLRCSRAASTSLRSRPSTAHCDSARRNPFLAPYAAAWNPPLRPPHRVATTPCGRRAQRGSPAESPQEGGRSEVKRSRAGSSHGEPRTEPRPPWRRSRSVCPRGAPVRASRCRGTPAVGKTGGTPLPYVVRSLGYPHRRKNGGHGESFRNDEVFLRAADHS